jgi:hypothetical protein
MKVSHIGTEFYIDLHASNEYECTTRYGYHICELFRNYAALACDVWLKDKENLAPTWTESDTMVMP